MTSHRGNFIFHENPSSWDENGKMAYTGSGSPEIYINKVNTSMLNKLGWEMVDLGNRSIQVKKLN